VRKIMYSQRRPYLILFVCCISYHCTATIAGLINLTLIKMMCNCLRWFRWYNSKSWVEAYNIWHLRRTIGGAAQYRAECFSAAAGRTEPRARKCAARDRDQIFHLFGRHCVYCTIRWENDNNQSMCMTKDNGLYFFLEIEQNVVEM